MDRMAIILIANANDLQLRSLTLLNPGLERPRGIQLALRDFDGLDPLLPHRIDEPGLEIEGRATGGQR